VQMLLVMWDPIWLNKGYTI